MSEAKARLQSPSHPRSNTVIDAFACSIEPSWFAAKSVTGSFDLCLSNLSSLWSVFRCVPVQLGCLSYAGRRVRRDLGYRCFLPGSTTHTEDWNRT